MKREIQKKLYLFLIIILLSFNVVFAANMFIESDVQEVDLSKNEIKLEGKVKVKLDDATVESPRALGKIDKVTNKVTDVKFVENPYAFQIKGNRKNEIKAKIISISLVDKIIKAQGDTQSVMMNNQKPMLIINSDSQQYDTQTEKMQADGSVIVYYRDAKTFSDKAIVDISKNGNVNRIELIGNAIIEQDKNRAKADRFVYVASRQEVMSIGNTYSEANIEDTLIKVWGNFQQYNRASNTIVASGNVKVQYKDYTAFGPKASVFPDKKTCKLNKVVFLGRARIIQEGRKIEADKIVMTMEPKNFLAQGNVKTTIENVESLSEDGYQNKAK